MRVRISPHERALVVRQRAECRCGAQKSAIALGCESIAGEALPSVVGFSPENHGLPSECELQTGGAVHGYTSVDELEKVRRAYVFLRRNNANVIGKVREIFLDQTLNAVFRIARGFSRVNLDQPLDFRRRYRGSDGV